LFIFDGFEEKLLFEQRKKDFDKQNNRCVQIEASGEEKGINFIFLFEIM
jgi:hypothetical protein